ncbi:helix-turn-helix domain-containing protein [Dokdonella ginsengisoli]|uniref:Helix-turn-helix domain-containing protein n=1 Tax=Dokdonella ginsengisoli TaxID=363846 RepID=A0ABV9QYX6_9GAMM
MSPRPQILLTAAQLGSTLQAARKAQGWTQAELAGRIGLSQSRVSHLELHAGELSVEQLLAWCAALGLELAVGTRGASASSSGGPADW